MTDAPAYHPPAPVEAEMVRLDPARVDDNIQPRTKGTDKAYAAELAGRLTVDPAFDFPPVTPYHDPATGKYWLSSGFHRIAAYVLAGRTWVSYDVREGTWDDAWKDARNNARGRSFSNEDKEKVVNEILDAGYGWSDETVAAYCGVTNPFVGKVRADRAGVAAAAAKARGNFQRLEILRPSSRSRSLKARKRGEVSPTPKRPRSRRSANS